MNKVSDIPSTLNASSTTPLMQQYLRLKEKHPEEILFFRLGDFYEMFYDDAIKASPILEVVLTQRQSVPMCGIPYHAAATYVAKILKAGLSVAIAEQMEDPKKTKGMVKREVVRVITPGTLVESELLPARANNFLVAIEALASGKAGLGRWALAAADISTGQQWLGEEEKDVQWNALRAQLAALNPSEILLVGDTVKVMGDVFGKLSNVRLEPLPPQASNPRDHVVKAIQQFLKRHHTHLEKSLGAPEPLPTTAAGTLFLSEAAIRHLELVEPLDPLDPGPTLLSLLDRTPTPMGGRLMRWWLLHPSTEKQVIAERHEQVEGFLQHPDLRETLRQLLKQVSDIERISIRAQANLVSPRELGALRHSLSELPKIKTLLKSLTERTLIESYAGFDLGSPGALMQALNTQLALELPAKLDEGGVISDGISQELDELRALRRGGKQWIAELEAKERERTGIGSLKVGYNDVFGYYLEVSKSNLSKVPPEWIRKQTLANGERYITPDLKEQEEKLLNAEERILELEKKLFGDLVHEVAAFGPTLADIAGAVARVDVLASLAEAAAQYHWVRPAIEDSIELSIKQGRHPVVEKQLGRGRFIPNDMALGEGTQILIITGPNMAGKSTYLRQAALIVIMAQMGSFVPAESAVIGWVDKIFTRIGATDRLSKGESTFMVEMREVASLLVNSTPRSLLILDEVGRGTSTYDGISIAWAVVEHLTKMPMGPRTLFATHYFELTQLTDRLFGVANAHATAKEWPGPDGQRHVVFLYQIRPGPADRSYGLHVAEMAGVPEACVKRAREILGQLESGNHKLNAVSPSKEKGTGQLDLFGEHPVVEELRRLDVDGLTPIEALNKLAEMKEKLS
ncbi:MAG: DNA mismatch repair protein MutS [Elusimicrobia bacterium]|nr:DNA mismatch repair protein MutS [Candidatus Obscuribacterium magneticum]